MPEPVGAAISTCRPAWIAGHASACAAVGAAKLRSNQAATAGWKRWVGFTGNRMGTFGDELKRDVTVRRIRLRCPRRSDKGISAGESTGRPWGAGRLGGLVGACSVTSPCSISMRRAAGPLGPTLCRLTRAPSHIRNTLSASSSGSRSRASRQRRTSFSRCCVFCWSMKRRAGWLGSDNSTAVLAKAQPRSAAESFHSPICRSQARSCPLGSPACATAMASQETSNSAVRRRRHSTTSTSFEFEMAIERHFIGAGSLGDGVDTDGMDALAVEQLARRHEYTLAWGQLLRWLGRRRSADRYLRFRH